jgi:hypothetical protein
VRASAALAGVALAAGAAACAGPGSIDLARVPDSPVALVYRDEALSLERLDALRDLKKRGAPSPDEGVVQLEGLDALFGGSPRARERLQATEGHLALFDPRTGATDVLTSVPAGARPLAWSPDRSRLLVAGRWRDAMQLFVWERATRTIEIATAGEDHPMGCLGANGRLVAVAVRRLAHGYMARLVSTPAGGGGLRPLTAGPSDVEPACSPTADLVAYVTAGVGGGLTLAVLDLGAPDSQPRLLGAGSDPVFTPDGAWIVYVASTTEGKRLFRIRPDGDGRTPIGNGRSEETHPAVSPDGAYVAYVTKDEDDRERLRVRRFDGTGDRPFLTSGDASSPAW